MSSVTPLTPEALAALLKQSDEQRALWMIEDVAAQEEAWGLEDANGWVVAKLAAPLEDGPAYALPLWPRQELAALEAAGPAEQPRVVDMETLLEELLPEIAERHWGVLAFSVKNAGRAYRTEEFSAALAESWEAVAED